MHWGSVAHKVSLGTDFERDTTGGGLGVVDGLGTGLDILADSVVVRGGKGGEVAQTVKGDGVVWGGVTESTGVSGDGTGGDIVRSLGTDKETVPTDNGVGSEGGPLVFDQHEHKVETGLCPEMLRVRERSQNSSTVSALRPRQSRNPDIP